MQSTAARADGFLKGGIEAMRLQSRVAVLLTLVLAGCGGRPAPAAGFINQTGAGVDGFSAATRRFIAGRYFSGDFLCGHRKGAT